MREGSDSDRRNTHVVAVHEIKVHKVTGRDKHLDSNQHPSTQPMTQRTHSQKSIILNYAKLAMRTPGKLST